MSKFETIHVLDSKDGPANVTWARPEWADKGSEALVAYVAGYELEIGPSAETKGKWDWLVRVTAEISETPEVLDMGTASSAAGAKRGASNPANADGRRRAKAVKPVAKVEPVAEPKDMPAENTAEKVEQAVETQMATARAKQPRRRRPKAEQPEAVAA
jgi:hypothetical protein